MSIQEIDGIVQLTPGATASWDSTTLNVPLNTFVYDTDTGDVKIGDASHKFDELDTFINAIYIQDFHIDLSLLKKTPPEASDEDKIVIVTDVGNGVMKYTISEVLLHNQILTPIADIFIVETDQNNKLSDIQLKADELISVTLDDTNKIVSISGNKLTISTNTYDDNKNNIVSKTVDINKIHINSIGFYLDSNCTIKANELNDKITYYVKIEATEDNGNPLSYGLTCDDDTDVVITHNNGNLFTVVISDIDQEKIVLFTATCDNGSGHKSKSIEKNILGFTAIVNRDDNSNTRTYNSIIEDKENNRYIAVGYGNDGAGNIYGLITAFSYDLNFLFDFMHSDTSFDTTIFNSCKVDIEGNIVIVGYIKNGADDSKGLILKLHDTGIIFAKYYYTETNISAVFNDIIVTPSNNYIVVGYSGTLNTPQEAIIINFSSILVIVSSNFIGNQSKNSIFSGIERDNDGNYIAVGTTNNHGNINGLIAKFDMNLSLTHNSVLTDMNYVYFQKIKKDNDGNLIVIGYNSTDGNHINKGLILKISTDLNVISKYMIDDSRKNALTGIAIDNNNNYIVCGKIENVSGSYSGIFLILNDVFSVLNEKAFTINADNINIIKDVIIDLNKNYVFAGNIDNQTISSDLILNLASNISETDIYSFTSLDLNITNITLSLSEYGAFTEYNDVISESSTINITDILNPALVDSSRTNTIETLY